MTGVSERLDAIEARKDVALCLTRFPSSPEAATAARNELVGVDVAYLLDLARKQQAALDAVRDACDATDTETNEPLQADLVARIRAAITREGK